MASTRVRLGKRKGTDPDLAQLLKLVLAKLGDGDSDGWDVPSEGDDAGEGPSRPRRAHVAPRAAFPPVKRRSKKQLAAVQQASATQAPPPPPPTVDPVPLGAPMPTSLTGVNPVPQPIEVIDVSGPALGVDSMLADIRRSLAVLAAPTTGLPVHASYSTQGVTPVGGIASELGRSEPNPPGVSQDPTTQALLEVSQMLTKLSAPPAPPPPPTTPWGSDSFQSSVQDLKRQVEALATARVVPSLQVSSASPCVSLASGSLTQTPQVEKEHGKGSEQGVSATKPLASAEGSGVDTLLSRPGKLAAHVAPEIKEKIWKGEFVDIFSLVRA
ncbi:hypothetical protein NDU88_002934 [Pleurodeles waltl]|uniref:Uncharacterized protein n=1 Tax=Pleurodeles waltl TaxID=8319 RepID=A0AAV7TM63_PLEWA|nr:hypothetical protein NDU88_002934 [Pleurodeles waltl]